MTKMILAAVMTSAFLLSMPVRAEEKEGDKTEKAEKAAKKDKKKAEGKKEEKTGGGW